MTTAPRTWVVGETVTAAMLNAEIRDQNNSIFGAWTAYTPTWTAITTAPALGNGTLTGRYLKVGRRVDCHIEMVAGSSTTYGSGGWSFGLPATAAPAGTGNRIGNAQALGTGVRYGGQIVAAVTATDTSPFFPSGSAVSNLSACAAGVPFTWASTNVLRMTFTYESAS